MVHEPQEVLGTKSNRDFTRKPLSPLVGELRGDLMLERKVTEDGHIQQEGNCSRYELIFGQFDKSSKLKKKLKTYPGKEKDRPSDPEK